MEIRKPFVIGVVHLLPLPGSPRWGGSMQEVVENPEASKERVWPIPLFPATRFFQVVSVSLPNGVTRPIPVITTFRLFMVAGGTEVKSPRARAATVIPP